MKFILKEDWKYETQFLGKKIEKIIYPKGHVLEPDGSGFYEVVGPYDDINKLDESQMRNYHFLEELVEAVENTDYEILIEEVPEDDDNLVKNWRIQLDVKTTRKQLNEFEKRFRESVKDII